MRYEKGCVSYDQLCRFIGLIMSNVNLEDFVKTRKEVYTMINKEAVSLFNSHNKM